MGKLATFDEIRQIMKELAESQRDTDRRMKETDHQMKQTDRRLKALDELFNGQWGKLMEALVKGDLLRLLNERGIQVNGLAKETLRKYRGEEYEFDIIAVDGNTIVVVEVKTTLGLKDVKHFIEKLQLFKQIFPEYHDKDVLGAVAYLKQNHGSARYAEKQGLYVIQAVGSSSRIINRQDFQAKRF